MRIKKNQKPIEKDATFRYICPNTDCRFDHWISLKQAKTKNYKIVCDCGTVFQPKTILKIKIVYENKKSTDPETVKQISQNTNIDSKPSIPEKFRQIVISLLIKYGFSEIESNNLLEKAFDRNPQSSVANFVKYILSNIKELETQNE